MAKRKARKKPALKVHVPTKAPERPVDTPPGNSIPPRPEWLLPLAAAEWDRLCPELVRRGHLTGADWSTLAAYCQSFAHWQAADAFVREHGSVMTVRDDKGNVKFSATVPQFAVAQKSLEKMKQFACELGLTPASRQKLPGKLPPAGDDDTGESESLSSLFMPRAAGGL